MLRCVVLGLVIFGTGCELDWHLRDQHFACGLGGPCAPSSANHDTVACNPDCDGRICGDDGCGGTCGSCGDELGCWGGLRCAPISGVNDPRTGHRSGAGWPAARGGPTRQGRSTLAGPDPAVTKLLWSSEIGATGKGTVAIGGADDVYLGTRVSAGGSPVHRLMKLDVSATKPKTAWTLMLASDLEWGPILAPGGRVYCLIGKQAVAIDEVAVDNATIAWSVATTTIAAGAPTLTADGRLLFTDGNKLVALNADGTAAWSGKADTSATLGGLMLSGPNTAWTQTTKLAIRALWKLSGPTAALTSHPAAGVEYALVAPILAADASVYLATTAGVQVLAADGAPRWRINADKIARPPAIGADATVYMAEDGSQNSALVAANPDGGQKWRFAVDAPALSAPTVDGGGSIWIGDSAGRMHAVGVTGKGLAQLNVAKGEPVTAEPVIGPAKRVYVVAGGSLHALGEP